MLNEDNINKFEEYQRDYDTIMKSVHKIDKELKKEYSKLLDKEVKLEEEKAELCHKRDRILSKVKQLTKNLNTKIAQLQRDY